MVEQDYLLSQAVGAIFSDEKLRRQLAMRGGTVLHKGHLAPASRYSEDIDLVLTAKRSRSGISADIAAVLKPLLGEPSEVVRTTVTLAVRNFLSKSEVARVTYVYGPTSSLAALAENRGEPERTGEPVSADFRAHRAAHDRRWNHIGPCPFVRPR